MLSSAFTFIGLSESIHDVEKPYPCHQRPAPARDGSSSRIRCLKKGLPALDVRTARAAVEHAMTILAEASWEGVFFLAAIISMALVSGFVVMFIDLSLPAVIGLSFVALAATALSVKTVIRRHSTGTWLPPGVLGKKSDAISVPDQIPDCPVVQESAEPLHATDIPGEAFPCNSRTGPGCRTLFLCED